MDFQRKPLPFLHRGMNWSTPPEKLADGQISYGKNIRVLEQGTISTAHGYTAKFPGLTLGKKYIHTMTRLNLIGQGYDPGLRRTYVVGGDQDLFVGQDAATFNHTGLASEGGLNPVATPNANPFISLGNGHAFSGFPLSVVDTEPSGAAAPWKYIGDSQQNVTVGYYPTDVAGSTMARALSIGLPVPVSLTPIGILPGTGVQPGLGPNLFGNYQWAFAYRRIYTGARSNPSAATRYSLQGNQLSLAHPATGPAVNIYWTAVMNLPAPPPDPQTGEPDVNVAIDIYRFGGAVLRWALVGSAIWNKNVTQAPIPVDKGPNTFTDNMADISLLAAPAPPQVTDPTTGLNRFNLYQPFVTPDIAKSGTATVTNANYNFHTELEFVSSDNPLKYSSFNVNWLPGSTINLEDINGVPLGSYTIYQMRDQTRLELMEDAAPDASSGQTGILSAYLGATIRWSVPGGTQQSGQPLPHLFGPYGVGQSGSYMFGLGDPNSAGTLYWSNGNDPDSMDIVNSIQVTSPSERLTTGCVYSGQPYCWSTERMFAVFPSLSVFGQFTTAEMAGAKGCWMEWSLSVQNNGFADQSVSWRGKDGIYDMSATGGAPVRLTDPIFAFFPHDGGTPLAPETIMPWLNQINPEVIGQLDDTQPWFHRLTWNHGLLFYDFVAQSQALPGQNIFSTLVWDSVNVGGWVSLDQPFSSTSLPVGRGVMVGANDISNPDGGDDFFLTPSNPPAGPPGYLPNTGDHLGPAARGGDMFVSWNGIMYTYFGFTRPFFSRVITRAEDMGDSRAMKLWGDYWVDLVTVAPAGVQFFPLINFHKGVSGVNVANPPPAGQLATRNNWAFEFTDFAAAGGHGLLQNTLGLDIQWQDPSGQYVTTLYQWQPAFVPKPEFITFRATDPSDEGSVQAKYLMGANIEANTNPFGVPGDNQPVTVDVIVDYQVIAQIVLNHDGQSEKPYAWKPVAGYNFQVQLNFPQASAGNNPAGPNPPPDTSPCWQLYKVAWIFEVWPDAVARTYPFMDYGEVGAKFIQGVVMPTETNGEPATIHLFSDDDNTTRTWIKSTQPLVKTGLVYDISEPFVAHELQWSTGTAHRIWPGEAKVIWQPIPELTYTWQTEPSTWGFNTWWWLREMYIAVMGGTGTPLVSITDDFETVKIPLDPISNNGYMKVYRVLPPMKSKWKSFRLECPGGVRLFKNDSVVFAKEWGSTGPFMAVRPFGDQSNTTGAPI